MESIWSKDLFSWLYCLCYLLRKIVCWLLCTILCVVAMVYNLNFLWYIFITIRNYTNQKIRVHECCNSLTTANDFSLACFKKNQTEFIVSLPNITYGTLFTDSAEWNLQLYIHIDYISSGFWYGVPVCDNSWYYCYKRTAKAVIFFDCWTQLQYKLLLTDCRWYTF